MRKILAAIMLTSASLAFACSSSNSGEAICKDLCTKTNECSMLSVDCDEACRPQDGQDSSVECSNEGAIRSHLEGCIAGSCDDFLTCTASAPACET